MPIDVHQHVAYWREGAREDADAAQALLARGHVRHALFFVHLSLEKSLKAHVCRHTGEVPPRIHNLMILAERTGLDFTEDVLDFVADLDRYNLAGRYPDSRTPVPTEEEARHIAARAAEILKWLDKRL